MKRRILQSSHLCAILFALPGTLLASVTIDAQWLAANGPSPYYLNTEHETYILAVDVSTPGSAFAITAPNVTFDLNGHTVTFNDAPPILVPNGDFEASGSWDLTGSEAEFAEGTFVQPISVYSGDHALRFQTPASNQSIATLSPVRLEPNTTYALSAMFYNHNYNDNGQAVNLFVELQNTATRVEKSGITWGGFQYHKTTFTTGPSVEWHTVVAGVENAQGTSGPVYIDDIRIQRTLDHGVLVGLRQFQATLAQGVSQFGDASSSIVENGSVRQGQGRGDWSHGVFVGAGNADVETRGLSVYVWGADSRNIYYHEHCDGVVIAANVLTSDVRTITNRHSIDGIMIRVNPGASDVEIFGNVLSGGPQGGIRVSGSDNVSLIYDNTISLRGFYSNGFGLYVENAEVWGNTINCHTGVFACRGIMAIDDSYIHNNEINVRYLPENQEYNGCSLGGTYGIQSEGALNSVVSNNVVRAFSDECEAVAFRINDHWQPGRPWGNSDVFYNEFIAVQSGPAPAYSMKASNVQPSNDLQFFGNTLSTNSRWLLGRNVEAQVFLSNTWVLTGQYESPLKPFVVEGSTEERAVREAYFFDNRYESGGAEDAFSDGVWRQGNGSVSAYSSHTVGWEVTVVVRDGVDTVAGAEVVVLDGGLNTVFSGTSDADGTVEMSVDEFRVDGDVRSVFGPFRFEATAAQGSVSETVDVGATTTVVLNLGPAVVDLVMEKTADAAVVANGESLSYVVGVENQGSESVDGAQVTDLVPADVSGASWTCVAVGGASCTSAGAGDVVDSVDLPAGGQVTYTITGTVSSAAAFFDNTAVVDVPSGVIDTVAGNNSDTARVHVCEQDDLVLAGYVISDPQVFVACDTVTAGPDFRVLDTGDVWLGSRGTVVLADGFSVEAGGRVEIEAGTP